ncbi:MAG: FecR domain-containing protein, partial [Thermodesulfobacteriota bacterium]
RIVIIHQETDEAFFGKVGDPVFEKDLIATLADTVCRIQFSSRDSASLSPHSILTIEEYLNARSENKKSAVLSMKAGRIFFYVLRLLGYRDIDFKVETPSSVAAVRGTKFGLHVYESKDPKTGEPAVFTNCYCENGLIEIDGLPVEPGELYQSATGAVRPAPPAYLDQFHAALNLPAPASALVTAGSPNPPATDESRAAVIEQNTAHTENIQEVRHLNLVRQESEPGGHPLPEPDQPPVTEQPTEPNEPPIEPNDPPTAPEEPPIQEPPTEPNEPPIEPTEPPMEEPPMEPEEPPTEPGEPPVEEPPTEPTEPPIQEPPEEPNEPEEPPTEPEEPPIGPDEPPVDEPPDDDRDDDDWDDDNDWDDDSDKDNDKDKDDDHPGQGKGHENHDDDHPGQGEGHNKFD